MPFGDSDGPKGDWQLTSKGERRGYIDANRLDELWFHTGTNCNLRCPFCLEGSLPGNNRIGMISAAEARPYILEAVSLGVKQFSFTGGEPFVNPEMPAILAEALHYRPCLVLTNGTEPLLNRWSEVLKLQSLPAPLSFRVSIDYPNADRHDAGRGRGNFALALRTVSRLQQAGFGVSIARLAQAEEDLDAVHGEYLAVLREYDIQETIRLVSFPDFLPPGSVADVPEITELCMTRYLTAAQRAGFMCANSRMIVKKGPHIGVYACTLVDDDRDYDLGKSLTASLQKRVMLRHHRCYSCFSCGASCSER